MIRVENSNAASKLILNISVSTATGALGAILVESPIGPAGGAFFGLLKGATRIPLKWISTNILNVDHPHASQSAKTLAVALEFFGRLAIAWGVLAAAGMTMTLGEATLLVCGMLCYHVILGIVLGILETMRDCRNN